MFGDDVLGHALPPRRHVYDDFDESELEEGSDIDDSYCHCTSNLGDSGLSKVTPPIRKTGYLERIDVEDELRGYESRRNNLKSKNNDSNERHSPRSGAF